MFLGDAETNVGSLLLCNVHIVQCSFSLLS